MKKNIFIVDDSPTIRKIIDKAITVELKVNTYCFEDGEQAIKGLEKIIPDIIISDLMMPNIDGVELCKYIKNSEKYSNIYFIVVSTKSELEDKVGVFNIGADEYITKPFEMHELLARLKAGLRIKELVDSLKNKNEELQKLTEFKNELLGVAAHDLRNPISVIRMITETIKTFRKNGGVSEEEIENFLELIYNECNHMLDLINDILDISKIEAGKIEIKKSENELNPFIEQILKKFEILAKNKELTLIKELDEKINKVNFDSARLDQVISNLISNALKFTPKGGKIFVRTKLVNNNVYVEVEDTGLGIPENELKNLFQPFKQTSTKSLTGEKGTGLGLAIVKKIVNLHNGEIFVQSKVNKGTKFYFTLPL